MNIIVCVDKSGGMMFNGRRQSQDREVVSKILSLTEGKRLFVSEYSAKLFLDVENLLVDKEPLLKAEETDFCFIEDTEILPERVSEVFLFNWNRDYPADKYFELDIKNDFKRVSKTEFLGHSHKKITLEVYRRK